MIAGLSKSFARFYTLYIINDFGDSCQACLFPDPAGFGKLVGRAWLLPRKLYSSKRQGWQSLLDKGGSCPGSFIPLSGRGGRACRRREAPAKHAFFPIRHGSESEKPADDPTSFVVEPDLSEIWHTQTAGARCSGHLPLLFAIHSHISALQTRLSYLSSASFTMISQRSS